MASRPKQNKLSNKFTGNPSSRRSRNVDKGHLHALQCLERMEEFRTSEILCDVVLESCDGALFKVHRLVLAACSSYFQAMFTNEMRESKEEKIKIPLESHVLKLLIEYAYTCKMDLKSLTQVKAVLVAANMLLFNGAEKICVDYIGRKINTKNCVEVITVAEMISSQELSRIAFEFMEKNFVELSCQKGFLSIPADILKKLISSNSLDICCNEEGVLKFALAWISHDVTNRREHYPDVMKNIRLPLVPRNLLMELLGSDFGILKNAGCETLVEEINTYQLHPEKRALLQTPRTTPRNTTPKTLCIVGGLSGFDSPDRYLSRADVLCLEDEKKWGKMASMREARESAAVVKLNNLIYVMGGVSADANLSSVECYNPQLDSWTGLPPLKYCKGQVSGTVLNGCIYVIGGTDDSLREGLKTVEKYNPCRNEWEVVSPMRIGRGALGVASLEGKIYACGGGNFNFAVSSVEVYEPQKNRWSTAPPMKRARAFHDVVVVRESLYALGGAEMQSGQLSDLQASVERFHPETGQWMILKSLFLPCWGIRAAVNQKSADQETDVYIVGQFQFTDSDHGAVAKLCIGDDDSHLLTSVPYFDEPSPRIQAGVVIMP